MEVIFTSMVLIHSQPSTMTMTQSILLPFNKKNMHKNDMTKVKRILSVAKTLPTKSQDEKRNYVNSLF